MARTRDFAAILLFCCTLLCGQTPDTSTLTGTIVDQTHAVVPNAEVSVTNALTGLEHSTRTNAAGAFSFAGLPIAGSYTVKAEKQGFGQAELTGITLVGDRTAGLNIQLTVSGAQTKIIVTGVVGEVRTDEPQLGDRLSAEQMQATPLPDRKITYLPLLNSANRPAINQGDVFMNENLFTTNGAGRRQTWYVWRIHAGKSSVACDIAC